MQTGGMTAAHPSLPIGSRARVTNVATGEYIEVTIVGRIPPAVDRIVDLSPSAASALKIPAGGTVLISTGDPTEPPPVVVAAAPEPEPEPAPPVVAAAPKPEPEPEPAPAAAPEPEPVQVAEAPAQTRPVSITIHNYIVVPDQPEEPPVQWNFAPEPNIVDVRPPVPNVIYAPPPPAVIYAPPPPPPAVIVPETPILSWAPPAVDSVTVVPGLPSPNSNRVYRLQVGSYSGSSSASAAMRRVEAAGFNAVQESFNNRLRVIAVDIPAASVEAAVQRLAAMGFSEIWVRE